MQADSYALSLLTLLPIPRDCPAHSLTQQPSYSNLAGGRSVHFTPSAPLPALAVRPRPFSSGAALRGRICRSFAGDQARATAEGQVFESPLNENDDATLKLHNVNQVNEEPHQPGEQAGDVDAENICNRGRASDYRHLALIEIMKCRRFALT